MSSSDDYGDEDEYMDSSSLASEAKKFFFDGSGFNSNTSLDRKDELAKRKEEVISVLNKSYYEDEGLEHTDDQKDDDLNDDDDGVGDTDEDTFLAALDIKKLKIKK
jgi:hypothetical protein